MGDNIILTGMPGAGKSTVGVILAKNLGMDFIDVDILIAKRQGMTLQRILDTKGIEEFLEAEEREALELSTEYTVISTGGSMVISRRAMERLGDMGVNIFLDVPVPELRRRLTNIKTRGIAAAPGQSTSDIYAARSPLYREFADIVIDCADKTTEEIVSEISSVVGKYDGKSY